MQTELPIPLTNTRNLSYCERTMGYIGCETWNYAILRNFGKLKHNAKQIRLKFEKFYIGWLQPKLNVVGRKKPERNSLLNLKWRQNRPLMKFRNHNHQPNLLTTYSIKEIYNSEKPPIITQSIDSYFSTFLHGHYYSLKILNKGKILTDWNFLINNMGTSMLIPKSRGVLSNLKEKILRNEINIVCFQCNKTKYIENNIDKSIRNLLTKKRGLYRFLKYCNKEELFSLWSKVQTLDCLKDLKQTQDLLLL